jgi:hypothetical protein
MSLNQSKINLIVVNEHTLGYTIPGTDKFGILHTSILKGSRLSQYESYCLFGFNIRLASEKDFEEYRVCLRGYKNDNKYNYKITNKKD